MAGIGLDDSSPKRYPIDMKMKRSRLILIVLFAIGGLLPGTTDAWAQGRKPEKASSESKKSSHPVKTAKDSANEALNNVDTGVNEAGRAVKAGAEKALDAVDSGVHKVVGSSSQQTK